MLGIETKVFIMDEVGWICNLPESETIYYIFCLTFRLIQIEMADLISSLICDITRGTAYSCLPASQRNLVSVFHKRNFCILKKILLNCVALMSETLLVFLKIITTFVNLQNKKARLIAK